MPTTWLSGLISFTAVTLASKNLYIDNAVQQDCGANEEQILKTGLCSASNFQTPSAGIHRVLSLA
jgi:hypothetical protein